MTNQAVNWHINWRLSTCFTGGANRFIRPLTGYSTICTLPPFSEQSWGPRPGAPAVRWYSSETNVSSDQKLPAAKKIIRRRRYEPEDDLRIIQLHNEGYTWISIGKQIRRSPESLKTHYCRRLKSGNEGERPLLPSTVASDQRPQHYYTAEEDELILRLKESGMRLQGIANRLRRSTDSIAQRWSWFLREGATGAGFREVKARTEDSLGRKWMKPYTSLEMMTVVYFRSKLGMKWLDIARQFPERNVASLKSAWSKTWRALFEDLVDDDPRQWGADKLERVVAASERRRTRRANSQRRSNL